MAYQEFALGWDGITVVVNPQNTWARCMTTEQLRRLWAPGSTVHRWSDLDPTWPTDEIELYGPGVDSGTFDFFTEAIVGECGESRHDYTPSENDLFLVEGVAEQRYALGYFGFAYFQENSTALQAVAANAGDGCIAPTAETIANGTYRPLSRPLLLYANIERLTQPALREFVRFYLDHAAEIVATVGYVPHEPALYAENGERFTRAVAGATAVPGTPAP